MSEVVLRGAGPGDLAVLLPLVRAFHEEEFVPPSGEPLETVLEPLLADESIGRICLIEANGAVAGYIAVCFGYCIEFGGRDGFIDEFYVIPEMRGRGIGESALELIKEEAARWNVRILLLEVSHENSRARMLYERARFVFRERYSLMLVKL